MPYNAAAFGAYRFLERRRVSPLLCGVGAGVACAVATHPFDVVDARQQTARTSSAAAPPPSFFALETWASLARDPGALVRGLLPRVCALAPGTWLFFAVFRPVRDSACALCPSIGTGKPQELRQRVAPPMTPRRARRRLELVGRQRHKIDVPRD